MHIYLWLICVILRQKTNQHHKAIFLQLKKKKRKKKLEFLLLECLIEFTIDRILIKFDRILHRNAKTFLCGELSFILLLFVLQICHHKKRRE